MWTKFLSALAAYAALKGQADVARFLRLGAAIGNAGRNVKEELELATAKVQALVDEDRQPTDAENAAVDASIEAKLAAIAATDTSDPPPVG